VRPITDARSTALGKEKITVHVQAVRDKGAMWHADPLLGNDREISQYKKAPLISMFPRQKLDTKTLGSGFFYAARV
jgi:hypothetical protein